MNNNLTSMDIGDEIAGCTSVHRQAILGFLKEKVPNHPALIEVDGQVRRTPRNKEKRFNKETRK